MTVIAWDGKTLAGDKRAGSELTITVTKVRRASNGSLMGCCGFAGSDAEMFAWYDAGADTTRFPPMQLDSEKSSHLLVIDPDGTIRVWAERTQPYIVEERFFAIGSGRDFAMAAMYLGKTAREAVEIACALTATCGNGIDTLEFLT